MQKILICIILSITAIACSKDDTPTDFSVSDGLVWTDIILRDQEGGQIYNGEYVIQHPDLSETVQSPPLLIKTHGYYSIYPLNDPSNIKTFYVHPNLVVWSDFQGPIIEYKLFNDQGFEVNGTVSCITENAPGCYQSIESNCSFLSIRPGIFENLSIRATDGIRNWNRKYDPLFAYDQCFDIRFGK